MKKSIILLAAAALLSACGPDRGEILKVYNWSDYIDETVIEEFEEWYEEQTGEPVKVIYQTFDVNETMLSKIEKGHEDYDVVCPSDYIIERMLASDLLQPIDRDFGQTPNYIDDNLAPYIRSCFDKMIGGGKNANDYAVGYMWGTTGLLYNAKYVTEEEASSWDILRNPKFADKIFIKDSARDVFSQIILFLHRDDILSGKVTMDELMLDSSDEALAEVEGFMKQVKPLVAGWEADFGTARGRLGGRLRQGPDGPGARLDQPELERRRRLGRGRGRGSRRRAALRAPEGGLHRLVRRLGDPEIRPEHQGRQLLDQLHVPSGQRDPQRRGDGLRLRERRRRGHGSLHRRGI